LLWRRSSLFLLRQNAPTRVGMTRQRSPATTMTTIS
jgi:hypothetical protein